VLVANHQTGAIYFVLPITIAEIAFPLWLLIKGVNVKQWEQRALESDTENTVRVNQPVITPAGA
jgi:hypothetical protein